MKKYERIYVPSEGASYEITHYQYGWEESAKKEEDVIVLTLQELKDTFEHGCRIGFDLGSPEEREQAFNRYLVLQK